MPNLIYTLDPAQITVTNSFAENVMKLEAVGIPANNIIDIYLEAQKYAESIPGLTNPMRYIQACENQTKAPDIRFRELEKAYNEVVQSWSKLKPLSFIRQ